MRLAFKPSKQTTLAVLMVLSLVASLYPGLARPLRVTLQWLVTPLGDGMTYMSTAFKSRTSQLGGPDVSAQEARKLQQDNLMLRKRVGDLEQDQLARERQEAARTQALLGPLKDFPCELIGGRVTAGDSLPYDSTAVITPGRNQGVQSGMRVCHIITDRSKALPAGLATINASVLVGRITESGAFTSRVQLVSDAGFRIRARIRRMTDHPRTIRLKAAEVSLTAQNNEPVEVGEARGDGAGGLIIQDVPKYHNVQPGDLVVTCDNEAFLPAEMGIARITEVRDNPRQAGRTVIIKAEPLASLESLREVFVVFPLTAGQRDKKGGG